MTSAAKISLSLVFLATLSISAQVTSPPDAIQLAGDEAVRRQEKTMELRIKLTQAEEAQKKNHFLEAAQYYQEAVSLIPQVQVGNPAVDMEKQEAVAGLDQVRMKLTRQALAGGDVAGAEDQINTALKMDPTNPELRELKTEVDKVSVEQRGRTPSPDLVKTIPAFEKEKIDLGTQLQNGKLLYEMDQWDEAEVTFSNVLKRDPGNKTAAYYLDLIKEARFAAKARAREAAAKSAILGVEAAWIPPTRQDSLPVPNPLARTNTVYTSSGRQAILAKLERIHLNEVSYDLPLTEVVKALSTEALKRDPDGEGINFMINSHAISTGVQVSPTDLTGQNPAAITAVAPAPAVDMSQVTIHISPPLRNLRLADVLDAICKTADQPITYTVEDYAIVFSPKPPLEAVLYSRTFRVDPNTFVQGLQNVTGEILNFGTTTSGTGGGAAAAAAVAVAVAAAAGKATLLVLRFLRFRFLPRNKPGRRAEAEEELCKQAAANVSAWSLSRARTTPRV